MTIIDDLRADVVSFTGLAAGDVGNIFITNAIRWTESEIDAKGFTLSSYPSSGWLSDNPTLYAATFYYLLEMLVLTGKITYITGEVLRESLGRLDLTYQTSRQPRFFLSKVFDERMYYLLPHETYRMIAYRYIDLFWKNYKKGSIRKGMAMPQVSKDVSAKGYGFDDYVNYDGDSYVT